MTVGDSLSLASDRSAFARLAAVTAFHFSKPSGFTRNDTPLRNQRIHALSTSATMRSVLVFWRDFRWTSIGAQLSKAIA
jgi:hypothetical protein